MAPCRDYMSEVMACIDSAVPNWNVRHLSLWSELVCPEVPETDTVDLEAVEEATAIALYQEVKSKLSSLWWKACFLVFVLYDDVVIWKTHIIFQSHIVKKSISGGWQGHKKNYPRGG